MNTFLGIERSYTTWNINLTLTCYKGANVFVERFVASAETPLSFSQPLRNYRNSDK